MYYKHWCWEQIFVDQAKGLYCNIKHDLIKALKGLGHDLSSKFQICFPFVMLRMNKMGIFNALSKFEGQILSYNQWEFGILCFANKAWALLLSKHVFY